MIIEAGIVRPCTKLPGPIDGFPSIFQAEVYAISRCVEIILGNNYHGIQIVILSDSQAALQVISSKSTMVLECIRMINRVAIKNNI